MKVLTLGNGFVANHLPYEKITDRIKISDSFISYMMLARECDVLINCIGKTGVPNVDWCESHRSETYGSNVVVPLMIAEWCEKNNVHLINIASGCIYFGESPNYQWITPQYLPNMSAVKVDFGWKETDFANPQSYYSKTKYACDLVLGQMSHVTTLRIRMPISEKDVARNIINKLRGYKQVIDIPNSMTFMNDLVRCVDWAVNNRPGGIWHVVNPQPLTAANIMSEYKKYVPEHQFEIIDEQKLDQITTAKRSNCVLDSVKLRRAGFQMTNSEEALKDCMSKYIKNMRSNNVE
jgi:3,5-epimerase/4-reductase